MAGPDLPASSGSGTLLLIFIQVSSRALTFTGNQILLRFLSPSLLGIAVQLELVSITTLYFARESLRVALQRQTPRTPRDDSPTEKPTSTAGQEKDSQTIVNLSYLAVLHGFGISLFFGFSYLQSASDEVLESPYFNIAFRIYAAATLIELLAEPAFVVIQQKALYRERARAETIAAVARCLAACSVAALAHRQGLAPSILPFAIGQAAYAVVLLALYLLPMVRISRKDNFSLIPRLVSTPPGNEAHYYANLFHSGLLSLAATMYMQSIFKLLLTQGDALILSFLSTLADQGAFALASNYGGLLARLVFQPVEESSRNTFGRLLSAPQNKTGSQRGRSGLTKEQRQALKYLSSTLCFYMLMALPLVSIAPYVLPVVVRHVIGADWYTASTSALMSTYCYYIPLMAVNGILDAFVTSVATTAQLRAQSLWMLLFTAVYGAAAWAMLLKFKLGAAGLVGANMLNMILRIMWSAQFIRRWIRDEAKDATAVQKETLGEALPTTSSLAVTALVVLGLRMNAPGDDGEKPNRQFLGFLTAGTVLLGSTILLAERDFLLQMLESIVPQRLAAKIPGLAKRPLPKS